MMSYAERCAIESKLLDRAERIAGEYKYAYAFGNVIALLNDTQLNALDKFLSEEK